MSEKAAGASEKDAGGDKEPAEASKKAAGGGAKPAETSKRAAGSDKKPAVASKRAAGMNKKAAAGQRTKRRILKSAFELFSEKGYKNVTVEDIIQHAKSSKGAFYNHFASKDLLIYENIQHKNALYVEWSKEMARLGTAAGKLRYFARSLFTLNSTTPDLSPILVTMEINNPQVSAMFLDRNRYLYKLLDSVFEGGITSGEIKAEGTPQQLSSYFLTVAMGVLTQWCIEKSTFDIVERGEKVIGLFVQGLLVGDPPH
jgi:AcrR family transcriptional regulator